MEVMFHILYSNIAPLFIMVALGFVIQKRFSFNVEVFSKLLFSLFIPALIFNTIYNVNVLNESLYDTFSFLAILYTCLYICSIFYVKIAKINQDIAPNIVNGALYYNTGNFGLPLILLIYPNNEEAISILLVVLLMQNILPYTWGIFTVNNNGKSIKDILGELFKIPVVYALLLGIVFRVFSINLPTPMETPLNYLEDGLIALALLTLGIQLGTIKLKFKLRRVVIINIIRLLISPVLAILIVYLLGIEGITAQVLIISSATPVALNVVLLAIKFEKEPEFASQIMLSSTLFSAFTITGVIYFVQHYLTF